MVFRVPLTLLWLADAFRAARGFDFSVGPPGQCDPLKVTWSGGRPPFQLFIIPPGGTIRNISIPAAAFNSDSANGFYTVQHLDLPQGTQFMLSMSDADGIFAGGTSGLTTVGASQTHQACNTTDPGTDFYFSLDSSLAQCSPYPFTQYGGAVLPITILVNIPQGQSFVIHPPPADSFTWIANLTAGTPVAFSVYDTNNRIGGTSSIRVVELTNDTSCLTSIIVTLPTGLPNPGPAHGNLNAKTLKGLAIGISIGVLGVLGFVAFIGVCCYRQSKLHKARLRPASSFVDLTYSYDSNGGPLPLQVAMLRPDEHGPRLSTAPRTSILADDTISGQGTTSESHFSSGGASIGHSSLYQPRPFLARSPQTTSHPRNSKWSIQNHTDTGAQTTPTNITYPSDIIMHSDILESLNGLIELPPQYSENRPPLTGFPHFLLRSRNRDFS